MIVISQHTATFFLKEEMDGILRIQSALERSGKAMADSMCAEMQQ